MCRLAANIGVCEAAVWSEHCASHQFWPLELLASVASSVGFAHTFAACDVRLVNHLPA